MSFYKDAKEANQKEAKVVELFKEHLELNNQEDVRAADTRIKATGERLELKLEKYDFSSDYANLTIEITSALKVGAIGQAFEKAEYIAWVDKSLDVYVVLRLDKASHANLNQFLRDGRIKEQKALKASKKLSKMLVQQAKGVKISLEEQSKVTEEYMQAELNSPLFTHTQDNRNYANECYIVRISSLEAFFKSLPREQQALRRFDRAGFKAWLERKAATVKQAA